MPTEEAKSSITLELLKEFDKEFMTRVFDLVMIGNAAFPEDASASIEKEMLRVKADFLAIRKSRGGNTPLSHESLDDEFIWFFRLFTVCALYMDEDWQAWEARTKGMIWFDGGLARVKPNVS